MQVTMTRERVEVFQPAVVTIKLETEEEAKSFSHLLECWSDRSECEREEAVRILAWQLFQRTNGLPA